jgi:bifunctional DNA-binding transcriptional regulator/antitoxin component of YhaV-PrlF toxin-antitoxin module
MAVVPVDDRGRITLPKDTLPRGEKAVVIRAGSFVVVIPLAKQPLKQASSWLVSKRSRRHLKDLAEDLARKDAVKRAKRRRQI